METNRPNEDKAAAGASQGVDHILGWAHRLGRGGEDDDSDRGYVRTEEYKQLLYTSTHMERGGIIVVFGTQGIGKTAALRQLILDLNPQKRYDRPPFLLINWMDKREQLAYLFGWGPFVSLRGSRFANSNDPYVEFKGEAFSHLRWGFESIKLPRGKEFPAKPDMLNVPWAEKKLGIKKSQELREDAWFRYISRKKWVCIDLPDYAKTDKRLLNRHLSEISKLWTRLEYGRPPVLIIAVQKDLIGSHYFIDKADKVELRPLTIDQMAASYKEIFGNAFPFTESALIALAILSRGIYRRFKRYVAIAIESWPQKPPSDLITEDHVKKTITVDRVAEDMEVELERAFPKNPESRREGVQILIRLSESGPVKQAKLAKELDIPKYALSRLLSKLELHRYVKRQSHGSEKIVSLTELRGMG